MKSNDELSGEEVDDVADLRGDDEFDALVHQINDDYEREFVWAGIVSKYKPKSSEIYKMPPHIQDELAANYFDQGYINAMKSKDFTRFARPYNSVVVFPMLTANFRLQLIADAVGFSKFCNDYNATDQISEDVLNRKKHEWIQGGVISPLVVLEDSGFKDMSKTFMEHHLQHLATEFFPDVGKLDVSCSYIYDLSDLPNGIGLKTDNSHVTLSVCLGALGPPFFHDRMLTFGRTLCQNHQLNNGVHFRQALTKGQAILYTGSVPSGFAPKQPGILYMLTIHCRRSGYQMNAGCWDCALNG